MRLPPSSKTPQWAGGRLPHRAPVQASHACSHLSAFAAAGPSGRHAISSCLVNSSLKTRPKCPFLQQASLNLRVGCGPPLGPTALGVDFTPALIPWGGSSFLWTLPAPRGQGHTWPRQVPPKLGTERKQKFVESERKDENRDPHWPAGGSGAAQAEFPPTKKSHTCAKTRTQAAKPPPQ